MIDIAYCLVGYPCFSDKVITFKGREFPIIIDGSYQSLLTNVLERNRIDIFIHTWNTQYNKKYIETFKPVDYIVENQPSFDPDVGFQSLYSRSYAISRVIELMLKYTDKYDLVVLTRPDLFWLDNIDFGVLDNQQFHLSDFPIFYSLKTNDRFKNKDLHLLFFKEFTDVLDNGMTLCGYPSTRVVNDTVFCANMVDTLKIKEIYSMANSIITKLHETYNPECKSSHKYFYEFLNSQNLLTNYSFSFKYFRDHCLTRHFLNATGTNQAYINKKLREYGYKDG